MEREPGSFDWGFGAGPQPTPPPESASPSQAPAPQSSPAQRPSQYPSAAPPQRPQQPRAVDPFAGIAAAPAAQPRYDNAVSFDPNDLGFEATDVSRRSTGRRFVGPIIALVIIGGLAIGGTIVIDDFARDAVEGVISDKVAETFGLESDDTVEVDLGAGIFIGQAFTGTIDDVTVRVPDATLGTFVGDVTLSAQGVPTSPSRPTKQLTLTLGLAGDSAVAFADAFKTGEKSTVTLGEGTITASTSVSRVPVLVTYAPTVVEGALVLTPGAITVDGDEFTPEEFAASKYAKAGKALLDARTLCVADKFPAAVALQALTVTPSSVVITASGKGVPLVGGGLTTIGTCETE